MYSIKVKKDELLTKLKANRASHYDLFLKAQEVYREDVIDELDKMLEEARNGKKIRRTVTLVEPVDKTEEYDQVISMLEMCVEDVIELDNQQFANYVLDKWGWKASVTTTNSSYSSKKYGS